MKSSNVQLAQNMALAWLVGENTYQFAKSDPLFDELPKRMSSIMEDEIPNKWFRHTLFRDAKAHDQTSQQLMKICAAARAAIVFSDVIDGSAVRTANDRSLSELNDYIAPTNIDSIVPKLSLPEFGDAVGGPEYSYENRSSVVRPVFATLMSFAVANLCELDHQTGEMWLPRPGLPSGYIEVWT